MTIRVGIDFSVDESLLQDFTNPVQVVRIPEEPDADIKVDMWIPMSRPAIVKEQWPHLRGVKAIQAPWAGVDTLRHLFPQDVVLCDACGVHDVPTAEWAIAAILAMHKCLPFYLAQQDQGVWAKGLQAQQVDSPLFVEIKPPVPISEIADATVLIVGFGSVGQAVETRLAPFGAKFLRVARSPREGVQSVVELDTLLGQADIVVLTTPLTSETRHLFNATRLEKMRAGALLVNAARGAIVDTDALLRALSSGRIRAAIDVTDPEPLPPGHPLWRAPNLLITPHIAGDSAKFLKRFFVFARQQAQRLASGELLMNVVTGEY